jgi:Ran GTPase-activating protein (RanGAP) involved in mRNA processing and transport
MTTRTKRRTGIIKFIGNVLDESKDLVDDLLCRAREVEHDVRDTVRRAVEVKDDEDDEHPDEIAELRLALVRLTQKVDELADRRHARQDRQNSEEPPGRPVPASQQ